MYYLDFIFLFRLIKQHPKVVLPVANSTIQKMSSFIRNIDFALDWILQESGKPLFRYLKVLILF